MKCAKNNVPDRRLRLDKEIAKASDHYVDDIIVNTEAVGVAHLANFDLIDKAPEKVLGLKVSRSKNGNLVWKRSNTVEEPTSEVTRREFFSITGKLVGHYPSASCSGCFIKRCSEGSRWDDLIGKKAFGMLIETFNRLKLEDPVKGS